MSDESDDIFSLIRREAAMVTRDARFVHLVEERLGPYASTLQLGGLPEPVYDTEHHFLGAPGDTAAFVLVLDSVNFGSGYFPHLRKRPGMSGYFTVATSLKEHWEREGPLTGPELRRLHAADSAALFGQEGNAGPIAELMDLFTQALNDLGRWIGERYGDDPLGPLAEANGSAARLVELVAEMPLYRDVADYGGRAVPLYKRAQILVTDLALAFDRRLLPLEGGGSGGGTGPGAFHDLERLTIFADNLVPHVLRVDGVLRYDADLLARIDAGDLIPPGTSEEVEIRAVALHAVERLVVELRDAGVATTARDLDYLLWNRGLGKVYKAAPRHRTRTVFY